MDSINDILLNKNLDEPPEIAAIKKYVRETFDSKVGVKVQSESILITAGSAALISSLRLSTPQIQKAAGSTKRLVFRIGR